MRRLLAIALLVLLSSALSAPLFSLANPSDDGVPICCRTGGKHHCMMRLATDERQISTVSERCPSVPRSMTASIHPVYGSPAISRFSSQLQAHSVRIAQVEAQYRVSFDRSRQKRGPPSVSL